MTPNESSIARSLASPRVMRLREDALLLAFSDSATPELALQQRVWALSKWLEDRRETLQLQEIVPGMGNLLLRLPADYCESLGAQILALWPTLAISDTGGKTIEIPVRYGGEEGPDLRELAAHAGLTEEEVIARHCAAQYRVFCLGFQPGFAYLGGLDQGLAMPRRATPRLLIPAGSVAIGGSHTAVYPSATPGGWNIIGHTAISLFDPTNPRPALLMPGDTVRFVCEGGGK